MTDWALERGGTPHKGDHKKKRRERRQTLDRLPEVKLFPTNGPTNRFCCFTIPLVQIIQIFPMESANGFPFTATNSLAECKEELLNLQVVQVVCNVFARL